MLQASTARATAPRRLLPRGRFLLTGCAAATLLLAVPPALAQQYGRTGSNVIVDYGVLDSIGSDPNLPALLGGAAPGAPLGAFVYPNVYPPSGQLLAPPPSAPRSTLTVQGPAAGTGASTGIVKLIPPSEFRTKTSAGAKKTAPLPTPTVAPPPPATQQATQQTTQQATQQTAAAPTPPPAPTKIEPTPGAAPASEPPTSSQPASAEDATPASAPQAEVAAETAPPAAAAAPAESASTAATEEAAPAPSPAAPETAAAAPEKSDSVAAAFAPASPSEGAPSEGTPSEGAAAGAAPAEDTPADGAPANEVPADSLATTEPSQPEAVPAGEEPGDTQTAALPATAEGQISVTFMEGSSELSAAALGALDTMADKLRDDASLRIQLLAYAQAIDNNTSRARRTSLARALAVRSYLIEKGVPSPRMDVRALGSNVEGAPADRVDIIPQVQ